MNSKEEGISPRTVIAVLLAVLALGPTVVHADPSTRSVTIEGHDGVWFPADKAKKLLLDVSKISGLQQQLGLAREKASILKASLASQEKISEIWRTSAKEQASLCSDDSVWKSPTLWLVVGIVIGSVSAVIPIVVANSHK